MNFDMFKRNVEPSSSSRRGVWIVLILVLGLLMVAATVLAFDGSEADANPVGASSFDNAEALREMRGILGVNANDIPIEYTDQGCLQDYENKFGDQLDLNCTANDNSLSETKIVGDPICSYYGEEITFTFLVTASSTASERYDVGFYFATDGDPNGDGARTGQCDAASLPASPDPPFKNLEPVAESDTFCTANNGGPSTPGVTTNDFVPCGEVGAVGDAQCLAQSNAGLDPGKIYCETSSTAQDSCGDLTSTDPIPLSFEVTAQCVDDDGDGFLDLPVCASYSNSVGELCTNVLGTTPESKPKCGCDDGFEVPIIVPPNVVLTKTVLNAETAPGDTNIYRINYENKAPGQTVTNLIISDTFHADIKPVGINGIPAPTSCTVDGNVVPINSPILTDYYGGLINCAVPDLDPGESGYLDIAFVVNPAATDRQVIPNTACIDGVGTNPADDPPPVHACDDEPITTPVSVAFFEANANSGGTSFEWETATETGNAGFNIYVQTEDGFEKVNEDLILSQVVDSLSPQQYSFEAAGVEGEVFYIADVSLWDESRMHGPFTVGEAHGQRQEPELIDWAGVHSENDALVAERAAANKAAVNGRTMQSSSPSLLDGVMSWAGNSVDKLLGRGATAAAAAVYPTVELKVSEAGIYRVTYEDVAAVAGSSLNGAPMTQLALVNQGKAVALYVSGSGGFGPGEYFDFYGEGLDTIYTDSNVYRLMVHDGLAVHAGVDNTRPARKAQPAGFYMENVAIENNNRYTYRASNGDPWYDVALYTVNGLSLDRDITIDNYVAAAPSKLMVEMWGVSDKIEGDDHHVKVAFNGKPVIEEYFDFNDVVKANAQVAAADVKNGVNTVTFEVPNDQGASYDMSALEGYSLSYPRAFVAQNNRLDFEGADDVFDVEGLASKNLVVYRLSGDELTRVGQVKTRKTGSEYSARFAGNEVDAAYFVSTEAALPAPEMALVGALDDINSGSADLLIIAHPNFISGLQPLIAQRQSEGLSVKVVDVEQIYKQYSGGVFDAYAIQDYVNHAINRMGTRYVLLAGGDTRDYRNYKGDSISFVPTVYAATSDRIQMAPVDPLFTDVSGDGVPDAAIGRFPVHTAAELNAVVGKTLTYHARTDRTSAVFAADTGFDTHGDSLIPAGWAVEKAYVGEGFDDARANLLAQMNAGVPVASFIGHSDTSFWSFERLFESSDAAGLTNHGKPMVVTQWGCFNTYFVGEAYKTLGDNFMLNGSNGAAAVTGATTITKASSEQKLGALMMPRLTASGARIGDAMQDAKAELNKSRPGLVDVQLGWTILGDPTLVVAQ